MYSFPYLEPVCYSMSSSNCCFLTCIQISQEADQVVCYFHLVKNFPQFVVIRTVKGFEVVNKAEVDVFSGNFMLFQWSNRCWQFDLWFVCLQCWRPRFDPWVRKMPWRRKWQPTPVLLPGKLHGQRSLGGYSPWGHKQLDMTERLSM